MIKRILAGEAEGIIAANMMAIANDIADAYYKIGRVNAAGGCMVTVDEGKLRLNLKTRYGEDYTDNDYVCCRDDGKPRSTGAMNAALSKLCMRNGLPHVTVPDFVICMRQLFWRRVSVY